MADQLGVRALALRLSHYLDSVERGATYVITRNGEPVAVLGPAHRPDLPVAAYMQQDDWSA